MLTICELVATRQSLLPIAQMKLSFRRLARTSVWLSLHERNFARYRVRPPEFEAWQGAWTGP